VRRGRKGPASGKRCQTSHNKDLGFMSMTARQDEFSRVADDALDPLTRMKQDSCYDLPIKSFLSEKGSGNVMQDAKHHTKKSMTP